MLICIPLLAWRPNIWQSGCMNIIAPFVTALVLACTAATAGSPLSGTEFDAYTTGKTLTFLESGHAYGIEQYRPGRKVKWAFDDGDCQEGEWYEPEPGLICFIYENTSDNPQCWNFFKENGGLTARFANEQNGIELYEARQSHAPLLCLGPEVGA